MTKVEALVAYNEQHQGTRVECGIYQCVFNFKGFFCSAHSIELKGAECARRKDFGPSSCHPLACEHPCKKECLEQSGANSPAWLCLKPDDDG